MYYYNPTTQIKLDRVALKNELSCSFPDGAEQIGDWHLLHNGPAPETIPGQSVTPGPIECVDGRYIQTYVAIGNLETCRSAKLEILSEAHRQAEETGVLTPTGLDFPVDATPRAKRDIDGLVEWLQSTGETTAMFCGADDILHPVTLSDVQVMQIALIERAQTLYGLKWQLREAINNAQTIEALNAIEISF